MPAAVAVPLIAAAVPAVAGVAGSVIQGRAASRAADKQREAQQEALAYEREQEAAKARQYEARQRAMSPYRLGAASVLAKYGIEVPLEDEPAPLNYAQETAQAMGQDPRDPRLNLATLGARRPMYGG